ncbi:MAG TPA: hypothetical protein VGI66_03725 [Streptosporangiaceae bacterium]
MSAALLPWVTGGSGAIVVLCLVIVAWLQEMIVTGKQHRRDLRRDAATIDRLEKIVATYESANESLRETNMKSQQQVDRLIDSGALANTLAGALVSAVQQQQRPVQTALPGNGD